MDGTQLIVQLISVIEIQKTGRLEQKIETETNNKKNDQELMNWKITREGHRPTYSTFKPNNFPKKMSFNLENNGIFTVIRRIDRKSCQKS